MVILFVYCILIVLASLAGGWAPKFFSFSHVRIQLIISFVAGVMLGVAVLHLLPHSIVVLPDLSWALGCMLFGILFMFFMNRFFHFHHHDFSSEGDSLAEPPGQENPVSGGKPEKGNKHEHGAVCDHEHHHHRKDISWFGLAFGLAVHTIIDGIALAAAVKSETTTGLTIAGFSIFLAIVLHKPLDAISIVSLMKSKGLDEKKQTLANVAFSLMCPLGALLFFFGLVATGNAWMLGFALAFSAGVFLCISLGDLLPEVHFHSHDRIKLSAALLLGILAAFLIESLPGHNHGLSQKLGANPANQLEEKTSNQ